MKTQFTPPPQAPHKEKPDLYGRLSDLRYELDWKNKDTREALLELIDLMMEERLEEK